MMENQDLPQFILSNKKRKKLREITIMLNKMRDYKSNSIIEHNIGIAIDLLQILKDTWTSEDFTSEQD
jgi:hypothetical protein